MEYCVKLFLDCLWDGDPMLNLYPDCIVSEEHFQIKTYNEMGIMFKGGKGYSNPFGGTMGWIDVPKLIVR